VVARSQTVRRIEHLHEAVRHSVVVDGHELGDLGAAIAELGPAPPGSTIIMPIPNGATSWATDSTNPRSPT
jgi:hypothetical protein